MKALKKYKFPFIVKKTTINNVILYKFYKKGNKKELTTERFGTTYVCDYLYVKKAGKIFDGIIGTWATNIKTLKEAKDFIYYHDKRKTNENV
jgi:hypothetical protein